MLKKNLARLTTSRTQSRRSKKKTQNSEPQARKFDLGKLRMDLIPIKPLRDLAKVLTFGAGKYGERNWESGLKWSRPYAAILRHLTSWWCGETHDPETGINHLAHVMCNVAFLLEYDETHRELDDRPRGKHDQTRAFSGKNRLAQ
ncbi:hypothetical protein [Caudoviricetes sp.]|nr:hypothetical protein [Caudoviricetes sp.]